jgi:hypothetical protein
MNVTRCFFVLSLSGMLLAPLQHACAQSDQDLIEVARSAVSADRKTVVIGAMQLTDAEAKDFWPLYREYRAAMDKVIDARMKLIVDYSKLYPNIPDEQAKEMLSTYTSLEEKEVKQRALYLKKFCKILSPAKALRFAQVETRLDMLIHLNLAARIPINPISDTK